MISRQEDGLYVIDPKPVVNSNKFRGPAIMFKKHGYYTAAPNNTTAYIEYWREEKKRSLEGYYAEDGDWISGFHYFYLNYCPILLVREEILTDAKGHVRKVVERKRDFPDFWDSDYDYFNAIEYAQREGKHLVVLKARSKGYSFKGGSMLCRNFFLIKDSLSYAVASEMEFLLKDGLLSKAWEFMDFIDQNTAWAKKRQKINTKTQRRASYIVTDEFGVKSEDGYKSEIMGVSLKNDPDKIRGKRGQLILWEEGGKFPQLVKAWQIAQSLVEKDGIAFGLMIGFGTGGTDEADYEGLKELFLFPNGYNALPFKNIWDDGGGTCGFFVPDYVNMYGSDKEDTPFMDADGNTNYHVSMRYGLAARAVVLKGANDRNAIDRYIAEHPFNPTEACLQIAGNIFPKEELIRHLAYIRNTESLKNYKQVGDLDFGLDGTLKWTPSKKPKDINKYKLRKEDNKRGQVVIWEHPVENPPYGLYIAGCLTPGEKVLTDKGLVNVEDVDHSYKLVSKEGAYTDILALLRYDKNNEDTYELKMSNTFRTTRFTKEHPIFASTHNLNKQNEVKEELLNFDFKKVSGLKASDWVKYPNLYYNPDIFEMSEEARETAWVEGLWLGDGWCNRNRVFVVFNKTDVSQIKRFKFYITKYTVNQTYSERVRENCVEISFYDKAFSMYLVECFSEYANNKYISEELKKYSISRKVQLLLGYLDSDGCVYKDKRNYYSMEFVSCNLRLLEDFQDVAFSIGLVGNLTKLRDKGTYNIQGRHGNQNEAYHLRFGHNDTIKFAELAEWNDSSKLNKIDRGNIKLTRTRPKTGCFISSDNKYIYFQIKNIKKDFYTGIVYNFETEGHTFCTHHIPTHNCDPYDHDQAATSDSLGSVLIYKRFQNFESYSDLLVAEFTGRPDTVNEFYETVRKLLIYYNAKLLYENEKPGLFAYFSNKHSEHLLADQPDIIKSIIKDSTVKRNKGIHMSVGIKDWAELKVRDWLSEEYEPGKKNLNKILSEGLLEELISYSREGNFDRAIAFMLVMVFKEEIHNTHVKKAKETEGGNNLFRMPLFKGSIPKFINL